MIIRSAAFTTLLCLCFGAGPAAGAIGPWSVGDHVRIRLVASGVAEDGTLQAAIEIKLDRGWKTYWRSPGEGGLAPTLDFSASANAVDPRIGFPSPERSDDGFTVSYVYHGHVVLPVRFTVADRPAQVSLHLAADLGVCEVVCIPVRIEAALDLAPSDAHDPIAASIVAEGTDALPRPAEPGRFAVETVRRSGGDDGTPELEMVATMPQAEGELFVEAPEGWYPAAPERIATDGPTATFRLTIDRRSSETALSGASLRYTLVSAGESVEGWLVLP